MYFTKTKGGKRKIPVYTKVLASKHGKAVGARGETFLQKKSLNGGLMPFSVKVSAVLTALFYSPNR